MNELPQISTYTSGTSAIYNPQDWTTFTSTGTTLAAYANQIVGCDTLLEEELDMPKSNRRIVQVFIADPNDNVPLDRSLLFQDEKPHLTDLTDQELFFELDIKSILGTHNAYRVTVVDKEASEGKAKDVMLEAAKIRDLKMTVVEVAKF